MTIGFLDILDIFGLVEQLERIMHLLYGQVINRTEPEDIKFEDVVKSSSNGYLIEGGQTAIDVTNEVALRIFFEQMAAQTQLVAVRNKQNGFGRQ